MYFFYMLVSCKRDTTAHPLGGGFLYLYFTSTLLLVNCCVDKWDYSPCLQSLVKAAIPTLELLHLLRKL